MYDRELENYRSILLQILFVLEEDKCPLDDKDKIDYAIRCLRSILNVKADSVEVR